MVCEKDFKKLNIFEKQKLNIEELVDYYCELRKQEYSEGNNINGLELRKNIYWLIKAILKADQVFSKEEIVVLKDEHNKERRNKTIYACTHIGGNDIQRTFQVIDVPAYLMLGDPGILYKKLIYEGLKMNGVIPLETKDREDRKMAYNKSVELLNKGGNLLIYPEGAWNVSPNDLVMKTFNGTVRLAKETGAEIVPIAVEQYDKTFYFNIGKNYSIRQDDKRNVEELNSDLRDKLTTLKWDILSNQEGLIRKNIPDDYIDEFQAEIINRCNYGYGFSLEDAISESFHDKNITHPEDAFAFLEILEIDKNNSFLAKEKHNFTYTKKLKRG